MITNIIIFSGAVVTMTTVLIISALGSANMVSATSGKIESFATYAYNYQNFGASVFLLSKIYRLSPRQRVKNICIKEKPTMSLQYFGSFYFHELLAITGCESLV